MTINIRGFVFASGTHVSCTFDCGLVEQGTLHVNGSKLYFCHDNRAKKGCDSPNLWGHKYSWVFSYDETHDHFTEGIVDVVPMLANCKMIAVTDRFRRFLSLAKSPCNLMAMMVAKVKPFEQLGDYDLSDKSGFITIKGEVKTANGTFPKSVEVRFSRFLRTVSDRLREEICDIWHVDDRAVESLHNALVAFQSGGLMSLEVLSGERILEGYDQSNYSDTGRSTLHKSCMSGKAQLLDIYVQNPQVKLAVLRTPRGIEARCLLWETESGLYADRAYYSQDWIETAIYDRVRDMGYTPVKDINFDRHCPYLKVNLSQSDFEKYPYLDNFFYMDNDGSLYATSDHSMLPNGGYLVLRSTNGSVDSMSIHNPSGRSASTDTLPAHNRLFQRVWA